MAADGGYLDWRAAVDRLLQEIYCITIEDAGFDEGYLSRHWASSETPSEFVDWFGNKFDLDRRPWPILGYANRA
jgi:hypothetical protein